MNDNIVLRQHIESVLKQIQTVKTSLDTKTFS